MRRLQQASHDEGKGAEAAETQEQLEHGAKAASSPRLQLFPPSAPSVIAPLPVESAPYEEQQEQQGLEEEEEEDEDGRGPSVVVDPAPLPIPPLSAGRRCLLPIRLAPGAPVQEQPALHSATTGRRYLFLRCLVREKARVMIMLAAVLQPVPTGSVQVRVM
jgi:hypothetical protein